jgi:MYXO-CTERM domain-containing protein
MPGRFPAPIVALAVLFASGVARGSPTYPQTIAQHLMITCTFSETKTNQPPCTICHRDLQGGLGTVNKKFGQDLQALYGLTSQNPALLISALDKAAMPSSTTDAGLDSDGDGDTDIGALKACRDPNVSASANIPPLEYGCGSMTRRPKQSTNAAAVLLGALGVLAAVRRRRRGEVC